MQSWKSAWRTIIDVSTPPAVLNVAAQQLLKQWIAPSLETISAEMYRVLGFSGASHYGTLDEHDAYSTLLQERAGTPVVLMLYDLDYLIECERHRRLADAIAWESITRPMAMLFVDTNLEYAMNYRSVDDHWELAARPAELRRLCGRSQSQVLAAHLASVNTTNWDPEIAQRYDAFHRKLIEYVRSNTDPF